MAEFREALEKTLHEEQYWTALDGGTYRGIVRKIHPKWPGWARIDAHVYKLGRPLRQNERINDVHLDALIAAFYRTNFWAPIKGDEIECQAVAEIVFDWTVTSWDDATKNLQKICNVVVDGDFGPKTLAATNAAGCEIVPALRAARVRFYTKIGGLYWKSWVARARRV